MLTPYTRSQFVEKIITDLNGREYRAIFFVALVGGEVRGRVVSLQPLVAVRPLELAGAVSDGSLCLPSWTDRAEIETPYIASVAPIVSPYFNIELFLSTQPTRAPSHV